MHDLQVVVHQLACQVEGRSARQKIQMIWFDLR